MEKTLPRSAMGLLRSSVTASAPTARIGMVTARPATGVSSRLARVDRPVCDEMVAQGLEPIIGTDNLYASIRGCRRGLAPPNPVAVT